MRHWSRPTALCSLVLLIAGCAGRSLGEDPEATDGDVRRAPDTTGGEQQPPAGHAPTTADQQPAPTIDLPVRAPQPLPELSVSAEEACRMQPQGTRATPTEAEFRQLLVGTWLLCDETSAFGTTDEVGLIVHSDLTWQKLLRGEDGELTASSSWEQSGSWESIDTSLMNGPGVFQLNLNIDGSGTIMTHPIFALKPELMRLNNMGVFVADYAKLQ